MKKIILIGLCFVSNIAFAGEPKATLCRQEAINGAIAIFNLNNNLRKSFIKTNTDLIEMDHSEGGYEVWDVQIKQGELQHTPYRITVIIDGCIITRFEMPFAG